MCKLFGGREEDCANDYITSTSTRRVVVVVVIGRCWRRHHHGVVVVVAADLPDDDDAVTGIKSNDYATRARCVRSGHAFVWLCVAYVAYAHSAKILW